ncbi:Trp biosynthesis-associated membrane protein [Kineococcus sp. GCM10028916]|uniref:Trp biosynthesis-associated membrane protein n=1 Tax=Kineococcus sp. GCM10028916 TaxID=3273394 RepID=UPI00363289FF
MNAGRERGLLLLAGIAGAVVGLGAGAPTWVRGAVETATGASAVLVNGRDAAPVATALSLVSLAAVVASTLGRRVARLVAAVVLVLGGAGTVVASLAVTSDPSAALTAPARAASGTTGVRLQGDPSVRPWPVVSAVGGVLVLVGGAGVLVRTRRWNAATPSAGSTRHERDATRAAVTLAPHEDPAAAWDSLTQGDDPTR